MSLQYSELRPSIVAEILSLVWGIPANFNGFASWQRYYTDVAQLRSTKLCTMFHRLVGWYTIYTLPGALAPNGILSGAKFTLHPSLAFSYKLIGSVTARHSSSGRQPNFAAWYKEWNYGTFAPRHFQNRALSIFRWRPSGWE